MRFGVQLIGLDLTDFDLASTDDLFVNLARMLASLALPIGNGAFVQASGAGCSRRRGAASASS